MVIYLGGTGRNRGGAVSGDIRLFHIRQSLSGATRAVEVSLRLCKPTAQTAFRCTPHPIPPSLCGAHPGAAQSLQSEYQRCVCAEVTQVHVCVEGKGSDVRGDGCC